MIRSIDPITIPDHEARSRVPRPRLTELLSGAGGGWMRRDVHVDGVTSVVRQYDEHEQDADVAVGAVKKSIEASWET